jgi:hypothetical protein
MPKKDPPQQTSDTIRANAQEALERIRKMNREAAVRELARKRAKKT